MKNRLFLLGFAVLTAAACCKEKEIVLAPYVPPSPSTAGGDRHVLVEELTGVRCTNCPDGARALLSLQASVGAEKMIIISNHSAGSFSLPYNDSKYDFRSPAAQTVADFVGQAIGFPTAAISRSIPVGGTDPYTSSAKWAGLVDKELAKPNVVNMTLSSTFDTASRKLNIETGVVPLVALSGEHRISVVITQDKIVDAQLDNGVKVKEYLHRHVLRGTVTSPIGDVIAQPFEAGKKITLKYSFTVPAAWEAKNCSVVAFVHHGGTPDKEVLQATEQHIIE